MRILLVAYFYPPQNIVGAKRPHALARWLSRRGHEVTVLTSKQSGTGPDDAAGRLVRTRDLLATRLNWRGKDLAVASGQLDAHWTPESGVWGSIFVPDVQLLSWAPFAVESALRAHRRSCFDAVITTSPLESAHTVGLALRARGVAWVADLRDGWRFEAAREEWPLGAQRALDALMERATLRRADEVVIVTEPLARDLRSRLGLEVHTITNGFDPDEIAAAAGVRSPLDRGKLSLAHTGGFGRQRSILPLLQALARLAREDPGLGDRVELVLAGARTAEEAQMHEHPEFAAFVRYVGFVPRPVALAIQRDADALVLATSGVRTGEATGKVFEYLAAARPVLVFGQGNAAAEIVTSAGAGEAVPIGDSDAAEAWLVRLLAGEVPQPPAQAAQRYSYETIAARYEQVLADAMARRGSSGTQRRSPDSQRGHRAGGEEVGAGAGSLGG